MSESVKPISAKVVDSSGIEVAITARSEDDVIEIFRSVVKAINKIKKGKKNV